ncbi:MAG TPA: DUF429 domain-containing protein [Anaeromyxobacteraceae bacterium]|nr:DUF429 domain-containing protein [Anaeromyxobacteraceae bacterium]
MTLPDRGVFIGFAWSGADDAGARIVATEVECEPGRARLAKVWRPFREGPGRLAVLDRFRDWLGEEARWAEGRLTVGIDVPFSLAETHLRQLGLLRQALRGPAALGKSVSERFLAVVADLGSAADAFRAELGKERPRLADCYRAVAQPPTGPRNYRRTFFGLAVFATLDAAFLPWDTPQPGKPTLIEVYPPHLPRVLAGISSYRDDDGIARASVRASILRTLRSAARLEFEMEQAAEIVEDGEGETLDAVLAALAAASAQQEGYQQVPHNVPRSEGWIYSVREEPWRP